MRIPCPLCGYRDAQEFTYLGDAAPKRPETLPPPHPEVPAEGGLSRPPQHENGGADAHRKAMFDYVYLRDNPAGRLRELWYHGAGCHAWLTVTRDTRTHAIEGAELASDAWRETAS